MPNPQPKKAKITDLISDDRNVNKGTERGDTALGQSLSDYGAGRSILVDKDSRIVAGNKTAAKFSELGYQDVIVIPTDGKTLVAVQRTDLDLDSPEGRGLAIADNRVAEINLDWDVQELMALHDDGIDLAQLWTPEELAELFPQEPPVEDPEAIDRLTQKAEEGDLRYQIQAGEVWCCGRHYVACADSTDETIVKSFMQLARVNTIDIVWSDPPYGINIVNKEGRIGSSQKFNQSKAPQKGIKGPKSVNTYEPVLNDHSTDCALQSFALMQKLFPKGKHIWWGANHYGVPPASCWIVWDKKNDGTCFADAELAWTNDKGAVRIWRHLWNGMLRDSENGGEKRCHPNQKPVAMARWAFDKYGKPNDTVLDPFLGSGMSIIAAEEMGDRTVLGFELSPQYCALICERWSNLTGQEPEKIGHL